MCLILFAYRYHPAYRLILAANRDEFRHRPADPMDFWPTDPDLLAGRDQTAGGTWLGVHRRGRLAAVTNFREPVSGSFPRSRGDLVRNFLQDTQPAREWWQDQGDKQAYGGFNLLLLDESGLWYGSNRNSGRLRQLEPGIYGLSNALLDSPWPKLLRARHALDQALQAPQPDTSRIWSLLTDRWQPPESELPVTGVDPKWEKALSSAFIDLPDYGTRCSTLFCLDSSGNARISEQQWPAAAQAKPPLREYTLRGFPPVANA